jgi:hypothetical protein
MNFAVERLESRLLLAASIKGKNLVVEGTDGIDNIVIQGTGTPGEVEVSFDGGTTFSAPFSGFKNIKVDTGDGDDDVTINDDVAISGNLSVKMGDGDDELYLSGAYGGNVKLDFGDGDDYTQEANGDLVIGKKFTQKFGDGDDTIHYDQTITVAGNVKISMDDGDDTVIIHGGDYTLNGRRASIDTGAGNDDVELADITTSANTKLTVDGGSGDSDDLVDTGGNTFANLPKIKNFETVT